MLPFVGSSSQYVSFGNQTAYNFERTNPFSLSFWAAWTSSSIASVVNKLTNSAPFRGYDIFLAAGIGFSLQNSGTPGTNAIQVNLTSTGFNDGNWHHVAATYDGSSTAAGCHIWVDGVDSALTVVQNALTATMQNTVTLACGARPDSSPILPYTGKLLDLAVYNKALTSSDIAAIYNSHVPPRLTAVGPTGSLVGYWLLGEHRGDTNLTSGILAPPTASDLGSGAHAGTMTNMSGVIAVTK